MKIKKIKTPSFSENLEERIKHYTHREADEEISNEYLVFTLDDSKLTIRFEKDKISYEDIRGNEISTGEYVKHKKGYYIKLHHKEKTIYDLGDRNSHNITTKEEFRLYDKKGYEQFRKTTRKEDNYYEDKETGLIVLHEPDIFENYKEDTYLWRKNNKYCLERYKKEYKYPNHTKAFIDLDYEDYCCLKKELINEEKELPTNGTFYGFDKEIFFDYFQNKSTIEDIKQNVRSKNYKESTYI